MGRNNMEYYLVIEFLIHGRKGEEEDRRIREMKETETAEGEMWSSAGAASEQEQKEEKMKMENRIEK